MTVKHAFVSGIADGADATKVRTRNWNFNAVGTLAGPSHIIEGVYDIKDYAAVVNGSTDDRVGVQAAVEAVISTGGVLVHSGGVCMVGTSGITGNSGLRPIAYRGYGGKISIFKAMASGQTGTTFWNISFRPDSTFEGLGFDSNNQTGHTVAISDSTNDSSNHYLRIRECWFKGWRAAGTPAPGGTGHGAIYVWRANGVRIQDNDMEDCEYGFYGDEATGDVLVMGNRITNSVATRMVDGIAISSSVLVAGSVKVIGNHVQGANSDPAGNGANSFGILLYQVPGVVCMGNTTTGNGANAVVGGGILMAGSAWGAMIHGNYCNGDTNGIYVEGDGASVTLGTPGARRGATVMGNSLFDISNAAIDISYNAGCQALGNVIVGAGGDGIVTDSDYVSIESNYVQNAYQGGPGGLVGGRPPQLDRSGIRCYVGVGNHLTHNTVVINLGTLPAQVTGLVKAISGTGLTGTYFYGVAAFNAEGEGPISAEVSQAVTNQGIKLDWNTVSGATGYRIYRGTTTGVKFAYAVVGAVLTYTDSGTGSLAAQQYTGKWYGISFDATKSAVVTGNVVINLTFPGDEFLVAGVSTSTIRGSNVPFSVNDPSYTRAIITAAQSGTYTTPNACKTMNVRLFGAGGGGGGVSGAASSIGAGAGGGGGAYAELRINNPLASYAYVTGAGGTAGANTGGTGGNGANSTFGTGPLITAPGGQGGIGMVAGTSLLIATGGNGGAVATGGDINATGQGGGIGVRLSSAIGAAGQGGSGALCGGANAPIAAGNGNNGQGYGAGGSGAFSTANSAKTGGVGGAGALVVDEYYD